MTIAQTTYAPDGTIFTDSVIKIKCPIFANTQDAVAIRVEAGWKQTAANQVARVDKIGFLDVITYKQGEGR